MAKSQKAPVEQNVSDLLQGRLDSLSLGHQAVARFLMTRLDEAAFFTGAELAQRAGTSEATVVRFARALGYAGFPEFQQALQALLRQKLAPRERLERADQVPGRSASALVERIMEQARSNADETRRGLGDKELEAAARALIRAEIIYVVGLRASAGAATLLGHYLTQIRPQVRVLTDAGPALFENIASLSSRDAMVAFSYPRYTRWTVDCLRQARERGAPTLAITDSRLSPAAQIADLVLVGVADSLTFGLSYVGAMCLIDALIGLIVRLDRKRSLGQLDAIERLLRTQDFFYGTPEPPAKETRRAGEEAGTA
jgi:DNA-binding MurR/RpiR family transcriptional regulator